jgi:hypothetical protein
MIPSLWLASPSTWTHAPSMVMSTALTGLAAFAFLL